MNPLRRLVISSAALAPLRCATATFDRGIPVAAPVRGLHRVGDREVRRGRLARQVDVPHRIHRQAVGPVVVGPAHVRRHHALPAGGIELGDKGIPGPAPVRRLPRPRQRQIPRGGLAREIGRECVGVAGRNPRMLGCSRRLQQCFILSRV